MTLLKLIVYVVGLGPGDSSFSVKVESSELVDDLKDLIKQKKAPDLDSIASNRLTLYIVKLKTDDVDGKNLAQRAQEELEQLRDDALEKKQEVSLKAARTLDKYFDKAYWNSVDDEMVHVLVEMPSNDALWLPNAAGEDVTSTSGNKRRFESLDVEPSEFTSKHIKIEKDHDTAVQNGISARAPSSASQYTMLPQQQQHYPIYNGRPDSLHAPPITIYHPVFAEFKDNISNPEMAYTQEELRLTHDLFVSASDLYASESVRRSVQDPILSKLLRGGGLVSVVHDVSDTKPDGSILAQVADGNVTAEILSAETKNEIGATGSEPGVQSSLQVRKAWVQPKMASLRNVCCCPMFTLSMAGPYMMISGAVLVDKAIVQPFTDYIWLGGDPLYSHRVKAVANTFHWLAHALDSLRTFYSQLKLSEKPLTERLLPYHTSYTIENIEYKLQYVGRLIDSDSKRAIFEALPFPRNGGEKLVVKFVEQYCADAHSLLASEGRAPHLHYCGPVAGGLTMVVMDFVQSQDLATLHLSAASRASIHDDIKKSIKILHEKGFVFGDLRDPNVLILPSTEDAASVEVRAMLVDFDWCGKEGESFYPVVLNDTGGIEWHEEVCRGGEMRKNHDTYMLEKLRFLQLVAK